MFSVVVLFFTVSYQPTGWWRAGTTHILGSIRNSVASQFELEKDETRKFENERVFP